jgi:16S rRNA processing protein RimM
MDTKNLILVAKVVGAHGIKGHLKVKSFTHNAPDFAQYPLQDQNGNPFSCTIVRLLMGGTILVSLKGIQDRSQAEILKGTEIYTPKDSLPSLEEDEFYHGDLIGLGVFSTENQEIGTVKYVGNFGGGDFLEIKTREGKTATLPFNKEAVPTVDLNQKKIFIKLDFLLV